MCVLENGERKFEVKQWVDCLDTVGKWCEAIVVNVKPDGVSVHYDGWADRWDEFLPLVL